MKTKNKIQKKRLLERLVKDLTYPSETNAPFEVLTQDNIEDIDFDVFFSKLTKIQDWHGEEEKRTAEKFNEMKTYLEKNLSLLRVCRIGAIEKLIIIAGRDRSGQEFYITTRAVET